MPVKERITLPDPYFAVTEKYIANNRAIVFNITISYFFYIVCLLSFSLCPSFLCVCSQEANTSLVRACWNELFTLGLAQCAHVMNLSTILTAIINHLQSSIQSGTTYSTGLNEGFHNNCL